MKTFYHALCVLICFSLISFKTSPACEYAGSNLDFIKAQTLKALGTDDFNLMRYFTYKALNAVENSKIQLESCGCKYAINDINEGLETLKKATRTASLNASKLLLHRALENVEGSLISISEHDLHGNHYASDVLVMNTKYSEIGKIEGETPDNTQLFIKIDQSLLKFQNSLDIVVRSVDCKEAHAFIYRIYTDCEKELLKPQLTEGKKYYNLRTKQIAGEALKKIGDCLK